MKYSRPSAGAQTPEILIVSRTGAVQKALESSNDALVDSIQSSMEKCRIVRDEPSAEDKLEPVDLVDFRDISFGISHVVSLTVVTVSLNRMSAAIAGNSKTEAFRLDFTNSIVFKVLHFGAATERM